MSTRTLVLVLVGLAALAALVSPVGCGIEVPARVARDIVSREWMSTVERCPLSFAGNSRGAGVILYCPPSTTGPSDQPTWLYTEEGVYAINDAAKKLTPRLPAFSDASAEGLRQAGLRQDAFREEVAEMITARGTK